MDDACKSFLRKKRLLKHSKETEGLSQNIKGLKSNFMCCDLSHCSQYATISASYLSREIFNKFAPLTRQGDTYYLQSEGRAFVIKSLNGREMHIDEKVIESLRNEKLDVSYVKIDQGKVDVTKESDSSMNSVDELTEMFQQFMKIEDAKTSSDK